MTVPPHPHPVPDPFPQSGPFQTLLPLHGLPHSSSCTSICPHPLPLGSLVLSHPTFATTGRLRSPTGPSLQPPLQFPMWPPVVRRLLPSPRTPSHRSLLSSLHRHPCHLHSLSVRDGEEGKTKCRPRNGHPKRLGNRDTEPPKAYSRACVLTHHLSLRCWGNSRPDR